MYESKSRGSEILGRGKPLAEQRIREILAVAHIEADDRDIGEIIKAVQERLEELKNRNRSITSVARHEGQRFFDPKRRAVEGQFAPLRPIGKQYLFSTDLPADAYRQLESEWKPDWKLAADPRGQVGDSRLWRCGGAIFCVGPEGLEGDRVTAGNL
ncbi:MAG: hypothetical protein ACYC3G_03020 [Minisyncoccota bacterium]